MTTLEKIIKLANTLAGGCFARIKEYTSKNKEVANHLVNLGMNYGAALASDFATVCAAKVETLVAATGYSKEVVEVALAELKKSLDPNKEPSKRSTAQKDAYVIINHCIKVHKETGNVYIYAWRKNKEVLVKGTYTTESGEKTLCKNAIKKALNLQTAKYVNFTISPEKMAGLKMMGEEFEL